MAEVYKAYHAALDRFVAIKLLHPFLADDSEFKERFEHEAQNVAKLRHHNIVQVYDFDFEAKNESYYMVMEMIQGPTLKDMLFDIASEGKQLPIEEALHICRDVGRALAYAHARNMIHRDVKPANIMHDVEESRYVLTDFGIAKIITGTQFTASGGMLGTPAYMAPEQALGEPGDERADIYSLGVILYQLCTGRLPFDADTPLAIILKHVNDPLPDPRELNTELPKGVDKIIFRAMAKAPEDRYQTAEEMVEHLEHLENASLMQVQPPAGQQMVNPDLVPAANSTTSTPILPGTRRKQNRFRFVTWFLLIVLIGVVSFLALGGQDLISPATATGPPPTTELAALGEQTETLTYSPTATLTATPVPSDTPTFTYTPSPTPVLPRGVLSHAGAVLDVVFSPNNAYVASASADRMVRMWDAETGDALLALNEHGRAVNAVAFNPRVQQLVSASDDRTVRIWSYTASDGESDEEADGETVQGELLHTLEAHTDAVRHLIFNTYGTLLASGGDDGMVHLWTPETGEHIAALEGHTDVIKALAFDPDNMFLASASADGTVRLWRADPGPDNLPLGEPVNVLEGHDGPVNAIAFDPNGNFIASAGVDGVVKLWSIESGIELAELEGHEGEILTLAYDVLGNVLGSGGIDGTVRLWNPTTGQELQVLHKHTSDVVQIAFSPDNIHLVSAGADGLLQLWDRQTGEPLATLEDHARSVNVVDFSPDGTRLISGSEDRTARIWSVPGAEPAIVLPTVTMTLSPVPRYTSTATATTTKTATTTPSRTSTPDLTATSMACDYDYALVDESYSEPAYFDFQNDIWWFPRLRSFTASLTFQNTGDCIWEPDVELVYKSAVRLSDAGEVLASDLSQQQFGLTGEIISVGKRVKRGEEITVEISMTAPAFNRKHVITWELRTPSDQMIGEPFEVTLNVYEDRPVPVTETVVSPTSQPSGPLSFTAFVQNCRYVEGGDFLCDIVAFPEGGSPPYTVSTSAGVSTSTEPYVVQLRGRRCNAFPYSLIVTDSTGSTVRQDLWFDPLVEASKFPDDQCTLP